MEMSIPPKLTFENRDRLAFQIEELYSVERPFVDENFIKLCNEIENPRLTIDSNEFHPDFFTLSWDFCSIKFMDFLKSLGVQSQFKPVEITWAEGVERDINIIAYFMILPPSIGIFDGEFQDLINNLVKPDQKTNLYIKKNIVLENGFYLAHGGPWTICSELIADKMSGKGFSGLNLIVMPESIEI